MTEKAPPSVPVGTILAGKYKVERVIGAGGMGIVVAARHLELDEIFAIKFMLPSSLGEASERFLREAKASARLRGEHVAKVHDVGRLEDGAPYMVMEFLSGVDLGRLLKSTRTLPVRDAADYVSQACEALAEAHAAGIVHRDVKPANLFLTQRPNGTMCIKVLDFGISKQLGPTTGLDMTKTGDTLGSPLYMSPEQMRSGKLVDPRSDIWSLGIVLYELTTGTVPFRGNTITEVCASVLQDRPTPLLAQVPGAGPGFEQIVLRCLEKDPARRFQNATDLARALRTLFDPAETRPAIPTAILEAAAATAPPPDAGNALAVNASWGTTAAPRPASTGFRVGIGAALGVAVAALCIAGIIFVRGGFKPTTAPTSTATLAAAPPSAPSDSAAHTSTTAVTPTIEASASTASPTSSASSAATPPPAASHASASETRDAGHPHIAVTHPRPTPTAAPPPTSRHPSVVDYGDRQ